MTVLLDVWANEFRVLPAGSTGATLLIMTKQVIQVTQVNIWNAAKLRVVRWWTICLMSTLASRMGMPSQPVFHYDGICADRTPVEKESLTSFLRDL